MNRHRFGIGDRWVGDGEPCYFVAEIGSNFDGNLEVAKKLIDAAKDAGADAAKFQSFTAEGLVSDESFRDLKIGYQAAWSEPTYSVYQKAEFPREWHGELFRWASERDIHFFTSAWDLEALELMEGLGAPAYKIGSGDVTWLDFIRRVAETGKPVLLSTGASTLGDVERAVNSIRETGNEQVVVLQCVANYPARPENANIRVLGTYRAAFDALVGYSDHTPGDVVALGAVALGAKVIEKHLTLDRSRPGPDHGHSLEPQEFAAMVRRVRELEAALGGTVKRVTNEEVDQAITMRRSLHAGRPLAAGERITLDALIALRPCVGVPPEMQSAVVGRRTRRALKAREAIRWADVD